MLSCPLALDNHMPNSDPASNGWHLDRRVPLALIVTLLLQTAGMVWWAANLSARVVELERKQAKMEARGDRITRLEANQVHISSTLTRIESKLDDKLDRLRSP